MAIGIDFGTTKTMVSWINPKTGVAETLKGFGRGANFTPSAVYVRRDGEFIFGEEAEYRGSIDPQGTYRKFKLELGCKNTLIKRAGGEYNAEDVTTHFLKYIREVGYKTISRMSDSSEDTVDSAVITVPVVFSLSQRNDLQRAAISAGFQNVQIELEPEAAAEAYVKACPAPFSRALIVDWGGGTLDTAFVERDGHSGFVCDREFSRGRVDIGGEELDRKFIEYVTHEFRKKGAEIPNVKDCICSEMGDDELTLLLGDLYEFHKRILKDKYSLDDKECCTFYPQSRFCDKIRHALDFTQEDYYKSVKEDIEKACDLVNDVMGALPSDRIPQSLLLAGGTCRSPVIQGALKKASGIDQVIVWQNSREAIALGAAYLAQGRVTNEAAPNANENRQPEDPVVIVNPRPSRFRNF